MGSAGDVCEWDCRCTAQGPECAWLAVRSGWCGCFAIALSSSSASMWTAGALQASDILGSLNLLC